MILRRVSLLVTLWLAAGPAAATSYLQFDFGDTPGSGAVGPAHADGSILGSETAWIHVPGDIALQQPPSPLIRVGREATSGTSIIDWSLLPLYPDIIYTPTPGSPFDNDVLGDTVRTTFNDHAFGVRIPVDPGRYAVYVTGNSDAENRHDMQIWAGGDDVGDGLTPFSGFGSAQMPNLTDGAFVQNDNYVRIETDVAAGQWLVVVSKNNTPGGEAVLSSLQVVNVTAIPEPQTYALLLAGLGLLGFAARRKKLRP